MIDALPSNLQGARDQALLVIGFAGGFRRSELAALDAEDVSETGDGLVLALRRSKTDQEGQVAKVALPFGSHPETCPVRSFRAWIAVSGITAGPVFRGVSNRGQLASKRLDSNSVARIVKRCARRAGLDPAPYAGHSLRAGFCTQAYLNGVPELSIMRQSRHQSLDTVRKYIRDKIPLPRQPRRKAGSVGEKAVGEGQQEKNPNPHQTSTRLLREVARCSPSGTADQPTPLLTKKAFSGKIRQTIFGAVSASAHCVPGSLSVAENDILVTSDHTMPIRPEYRGYYGRQWRAYRAVLLALRGAQCTACGRTVPKYLNLAHRTHDPLTSSVAFLCVSCHTRADAPHRLAVWRRNRARRTARCGCFRNSNMPLRRCGSFRVKSLEAADRAAQGTPFP